MNPSSLSTCGSTDHLSTWSRRRLLKASSLAGLGWLTPVARQLARGAERSGTPPKSLIILWMEGGMSQLDSFDPHPGSPSAHGSKAIATAVRGLRFGEGLPRCAEAAGDFTVLRSVTGKEGDHSRAAYLAKTGHRPFPGLVHPSVGAIICHERPAPGGEILELPAHISILPGANPPRGGYLGSRYDAFQTGDPDKPIPDLHAHADGTRLARRLESLDVLERSFASGRLAEMESERTLHQAGIAQARRLMSSEQLAAFDVGALPATEKDPFGDNTFGRGCLAAARLVEAGVRCVEVTLRGWDTHIDNAEGQARQLAILDPAFSALIRRLKERGLYQDTLVLVATEFGRTPQLNLTEGRDHWPHGFSMVLGGGGIPGGTVLGETDPSGESRIPKREIRIEDLHATLLRKLGINPGEELMTPVGRPLALSEGRAIGELL